LALFDSFWLNFIDCVGTGASHKISKVSAFDRVEVAFALVVWVAFLLARLFVRGSWLHLCESQKTVHDIETALH
jgi:hypothetical protein